MKQQDRLELELLVLHIAQASSQRVSAHAGSSMPPHTISLGLEHHLKILQALTRVCLAPSASKPAILPEALKQFEAVSFGLLCTENIPTILPLHANEGYNFCRAVCPTSTL